MITWDQEVMRPKACFIWGSSTKNADQEQNMAFFSCRHHHCRVIIATAQASGECMLEALAAAGEETNNESSAPKQKGKGKAKTTGKDPETSYHTFSR